MDAFEILVIILSTALAIALILMIVTLIYIMKVVKNLRKISDKASSLVDNASGIAAIVKKNAAPAVVAKFFAEIIGKAIDKKSNKKGED